MKSLWVVYYSWRHIHISYTTVKEQHRNNGINTLLYEFVNKIYGKPFIINLFINPNNDLSMDYHKRLGFINIPFGRDLFYDDGTKAEYFELIKR